MTTLRQWHSKLLEEYDYIMFDCDGVLWHESTPIAGAIDTLSRLESDGHRLLFVTNNSGKSRRDNIAKFAELGFTHRMTDDMMWSTAHAAAVYIDRLAADGRFDKANSTVYTVGGSGIAEELRLLNIRTLDAVPAHMSRAQLSSLPLNEHIGAVVVGIDDALTYSKVAVAAVHLRQRPTVHFIATNRDATLPTAGHELPGAGSCVAMVECASDRRAVNVGKPEALMLQLACDKLAITQRNRILMIGDRLDTDILFGINGGVDTMLVCTGINSRADAMSDGNTIKPTFIAESVNDLIRAE